MIQAAFKSLQQLLAVYFDSTGPRRICWFRRPATGTDQRGVDAVADTAHDYDGGQPGHPGPRFGGSPHLAGRASAPAIWLMVSLDRCMRYFPWVLCDCAPH